MPTMYEITIPPLVRALNNLSHILQKGAEHVDAQKVEHDTLLNSRLFLDMFPLIPQIQIATDMSKGAGARLAGIEVPKYDDDETTFEALQQRITNTIKFLEAIKPAQLEGSETRDIVLMVRKRKLEFTGLDYLTNWVQPNVYFHITTPPIIFCAITA